ncbi:unnamed protein product, partial [Rotaria magnacalcarata]
MYGNYLYPSWSIAFGWCFNMALILPIPIVIIYVFIRRSDSEKSLRERIYFLFVPTITKQKLKQQVENGNAFIVPSSS